MVKILPTMQETWVRSLGREDPLEKGMATQFSILSWRVPWSEEPGGIMTEARCYAAGLDDGRMYHKARTIRMQL